MKIEIYKKTNWLGQVRYRWRLVGDNNRIVLPQEAFNSMQALEHNLMVAKRGLIEDDRSYSGFPEGYGRSGVVQEVDPVDKGSTGLTGDAYIKAQKRKKKK